LSEIIRTEFAKKLKDAEEVDEGDTGCKIQLPLVSLCQLEMQPGDVHRHLYKPVHCIGVLVYATKNVYLNVSCWNQWRTFVWEARCNNKRAGEGSTTRRRSMFCQNTDDDWREWCKLINIVAIHIANDKASMNVNVNPI
jgi:hypothetical protein